MKKLYVSMYVYLILALATGVFWREITKILDVTEKTALNGVHTHLFALGFMMFLLFLILEKLFHLTETKRFNVFFILYHIGLGLTGLFMFIRGLVSIQVIRGAMELSSGLDASIAGMSGMGHIIFTAALVVFMKMLKQQLQLNK